MRLVLGVVPSIRFLRRASGRIALTLGAPRRRRRGQPSQGTPGGPDFEIHTFVNDDSIYERMRQSFIDAGFNPSAFVRLTDADDNPYAAITRIGQEASARYPILCHQDVFAEPGTGPAELLATLEHLDSFDPDWVVAGNVGVMPSGRMLVRFAGGSTGEPLPLPVVTLDENFLVFNARNGPYCSADLSDFHLYGSDVCLHALRAGGSAYVIDFPLTHVSRGNAGSAAFGRAKSRFVSAWRGRILFQYVPTSVGTVFISRSQLLQRLFGSARVVTSVDQCRQLLWGAPLRPIDRMSALRLLYRREPGRGSLRGT
jgi:hypothetical protein